MCKIPNSLAAHNTIVILQYQIVLRGPASNSSHSLTFRSNYCFKRCFGEIDKCDDEGTKNRTLFCM